MKGIIKKTLAVALPAAMLMCGCSSGSTSASSGSSSTETTKVEIPKSDVVKGETDQETYPISDEKITLTMWYPMAGSMGNLADFNDGEFWQWLEDKTNIHIEFIVPPAGSEAESFNLLFTSDNLPDIIYNQVDQQSYRDGMDACIDDGYVVDMSQYLDIAPNYVSWLNSIDGVDKNVFTDSGKMYGMWGFWDNMENGYADQGLSIRKDFLDKVGMDVPKTYDDWEKVLTAFKDQLGIEAPLYTSKYGIDNGEFMAGYGVAPYFYQHDGQIKYGPMEDGYKDYLTMMHDWYEKGLLDPDFSTRQSSGITADSDMILNDKVGALVDYGTRMTDAYISRGATNPDFWAVAAPQPKKSADSADPAWRMVSGNYMNMLNVCTLVNAKSEHIKEAIKWLDTFYAKDVYLNANYGIDSEEGVVWNADPKDGHRIGNYDFRYHNPDGLDSATVAVKYWAKNPNIRVEAAQIEQMPKERSAAYPIWSKYEPTDFIPTTCTMTADENTEYSNLYVEIESYVQENNVKFINGERSLDEYDDYRNTLKDMGIDRCIELRQAALDRYNAR
ncbi:extracellular solute-binding protein [Lactimicrobium massiliense]|uniref:extracellular solute-binding protein n=1 Tax=Lactimicrobium massiliense TaxID=2161814 RepID=UPI001435623E|nr:extracellular solute-binding protein [Lactimicrobium massiliense]